MKATFNLEEKDGIKKAFNAKSAASASFKDFVGKQMKVVGILTHQDTDTETGELKNIASLFLEDGTIVGGQSANIFNQSNELIETVSNFGIEEDPITVTINKGKSNQGREFLQLEIVSLG